MSVQAAEREPANIIAYPLAGRGERFPFVAPDAEGFVLGDASNEIDLFAALLQGVSFVERLCFDYVDMLGVPVGGDVSLTGGGARNRYWCQLRADVLGWPVRLPEIAEPAFGMAVLAASAGRRYLRCSQGDGTHSRGDRPTTGTQCSPAGALLAVCG